MRPLSISYRPLLLVVSSLVAMALAAINPWAGAVILGVTVLALVWQLLGTLDQPRQGLTAMPNFDPMSAKDYAELRRRYQHQHD